MQIWPISNLPDDDPLTKDRNDRRKKFDIILCNLTHPHPQVLWLLLKLTLTLTLKMIKSFQSFISFYQFIERYFCSKTKKERKYRQEKDAYTHPNIG